MKEQIYHQLTTAFSPQHLCIDNDSHLHSGPNTNSHFKVLIVSTEFAGLPLVKRHQKIYNELKEVMKQIHALQLNAWTPEEWQKKSSEGEVDIPSSKCAKS
jgi:BolA protein